jgi:hypothetical protein
VRSTQGQDDSPRWKLALLGAFVGGLFGVVTGPVAMLAFLWVMDAVHDVIMLGFQLFLSPFLGAFTGTLWGLVLGAIRPLPLRRGRLTIARLMLIVAIPAVVLALTGVVGVLVLLNAVLVSPALCVAFIGVAKHREHASRFACTADRDSP